MCKPTTDRSFIVKKRRRETREKPLPFVDTFLFLLLCCCHNTNNQSQDESVGPKQPRESCENATHTKLQDRKLGHSLATFFVLVVVADQRLGTIIVIIIVIFLSSKACVFRQSTCCHFFYRCRSVLVNITIVVVTTTTIFGHGLTQSRRLDTITD